MFNFLKKLFLPSRPINTGIILGPHNGASDPNVYVAGAASAIVWKETLKDGNWSPYMWSKVKQWAIKNKIYYDRFDCTTNAIITSIEAQEFFLTGKQVRYARRWVSKMAGTNQGKLKGIGNYMDAPAEWIRKNGLVLETSYPTPDTYTVDEFYAEIPVGKLDELAKEGIEWLKKWDFKYEFLQVTDPNLDYHLKHAPVSVVIPGHDICGFYSPDDYMRYRDSYEPWDKSEKISFLQAALKGILTPKKIMSRRIKFNNGPEVWHILPDDSMDRLKYFDENISILFPDYTVDTSQIYTLPTKRPF